MNCLPLLLLLPLGLAADPAPAPPATPPATPPVAAATEAAAPAPEVALSADLRDEYLAGQPILVNLALSNPSAGALPAPDLTRRPWLVRFLFVKPNGTKQVRFTSPPAQDPGGTVSIPARGQRRTLLEVPSGGALQPGDYTLAIEVNLGDSTASLAPRPIRIAAARPISADLAPLRQPDADQTSPGVWVHQAGVGADLYLLSARSAAPGAVASNTWLTHLTAAVEPRISAARASGGVRHVVWIEGGKSVALLRLDGDAIEQLAVDRVDAAWPRVELMGRPATDEKGNLHVLLWVPAPKGPTGELRLLTVSERGQPSFRRVTRLDVRPTSPDTLVDTAGGVHFLVQRSSALDLYSVRSTDASELPVPGKKLWGAEPGQLPLDAQFGRLSAAPGRPGGVALFHSWSSNLGVTGRWASLGGVEIARLEPVPLPEGALPMATLPREMEPFGVLYRDGSGATRLREAGADGPMPLPTRSWTLLRDGSSAPVLVTLADGGPLTASRPTLTPVGP